MPASRRLLLLALVVYVILPLPWIAWRPEGVFYSFDLGRLPYIGLAILVFVCGWILGERGQSREPLFDRDGTTETRWPVATAAIGLGILCSVVANSALFAMGALVIDESTGRQRIPVLTTLGSAHIFSLIYSGCLLFSSDRARRAPSIGTLSVLAVVLTIVVGEVEGRRTAVALPLLVYVTLALVTGQRRVLKLLAWAVPVFVGLFALATYTRTTVGDELNLPDSALLIAGDAVVGRLGNPLLIMDPILADIQTERHPLDPRTLTAVAATLPTFGVVAPPFDNGFGNELGHALGVLPDDNDFTGINSGWIGELLLEGGLPAVFAGGACLGFLGLQAWRLISPRHPAGLFLRVMTVIFVLSGFQMEVAFPIASLARAALIAFALAGLERLASRKQDTACGVA